MELTHRQAWKLAALRVVALTVAIVVGMGIWYGIQPLPLDDLQRVVSFACGAITWFFLDKLIQVFV